ncbi:lysophospholipid acyltransferase family protein [Mycolicibacterium monacense]|uniref:Phospholipid/glycerol acyltransferase n=3 Tax=unclassified Mycobacterium TaxID=2642494 RepID=A0A5Q5BS81_MYCSS|nr:lysophospholipid acyltransferase family protein [Mycolicibacterium monacense]MDA4103122.1 acyltransferase [Mycolicibacterium monacense DSM 44395]OBB70313.1 acyltransferase [Mycolicibacterium monacense]OBF55890.1 acyltransferase [Mycolicibacterium monacense]ORB12504.1 1-acyl-sn-glycerol-3-phosphate acyltransferase [Mycolicibacterium monacense DSM 44395]QHP88722.1 1-acyl-sn-glycerol-3-phosphate acyltransferase [Mycolicibacterium monacense DSM 44395]
MEPVFRTLEIAAEAATRVTGTRITYHGLDNIPARGGAVVAINHTGYIDFLPAALAAKRRRRRMRFMIKAEMEQVKIVGYLIRHTGTIPVDRRAGAGAYAVAVQALRAGELVGVYPEATISRSFELKEFKTGAGRMAIEADVPILPLIVWGAHRLWTKDHPRALGRNRIPVTVVVGEPIPPAGPVSELSTTLRASMNALLERAQADYPAPAGQYWVPRRLGGGAPTLEEARRLEEVELAERARKRAEGRR